MGTPDYHHSFFVRIGFRDICSKTRTHYTASSEDDRSDVLWVCDVLAIRVIHWKRNRRQTIEYTSSRFLHTPRRKNIDTVERETGWSWRHFRMLYGWLHSNLTRRSQFISIFTDFTDGIWLIIVCFMEVWRWWWLDKETKKFIEKKRRNNWKLRSMTIGRSNL